MAKKKQIVEVIDSKQTKITDWYDKLLRKKQRKQQRTKRKKRRLIQLQRQNQGCERRGYINKQGAEAREIIIQEINRVVGLNKKSSAKWLFCPDINKPYNF